MKLLNSLLEIEQAEGRSIPVGLTIGNFDGVHAGLLSHGARVRIGEVEKTLELASNAREVRRERGVVEQVALGALAGGIAHHAGRAADQHEGTVTCELEPAQQDRRDEVADVQAGRGRVVAGVERDASGAVSTMPTIPSSCDVRCCTPH